MKPISPLLVPLLLSAALSATTTAVAHAQAHPAEHWEFGIEAGWLDKVRRNSPLDYRIVPLQAVWRSPAMLDLWQGEGGARLAVRHRLALVAEHFVRGPEDYYLAFAAAPTFELWAADRRTALFYEIGGGLGWVNAKGVAGGQGQDLSFNWFTQLGVRRQFTPRLALTGGLYFTHHSNLGMTDPNPGIDVLGLNTGLVWQLD
ncbi:acyloxyacyl hydrolase [Ramlibacter tataouinensis]|uniref:Acyloxyacyl hydrolase n=1 Tax=Ramlibacter tataouinensis (strain ATCC BAA-407 / DSM 14655 / LMG 21543 / TTB310) TaxID=365046 RepID=F5XWX4_RAMTT|nr:acyloxyacyl hydrolase [Ramlibacter tataouinensis]AEG91735.1 Hypothetical protein Rta_06570 [Ramlibacter tataouinensis TTB310]